MNHRDHRPRLVLTGLSGFLLGALLTALLLPLLWLVRLQPSEAEESPPLAAELQHGDARGSAPLARVGDQLITLDDINDLELHERYSEYHQALMERLRSHALALLAARDPKYVIPPPEKPPAEEELRRFYQKYRLHNQGSFEKMQPQILEYMARQQQKEAQEKLYQQALQAGLIASDLEPPGPLLVRLKVDPQETYVRGNPKATVMLVEYSDYQCPFCSRVQGVLQSLREAYGERVAFAYRHFPLPFHREADESALAVECAREQGQFVAYHDLLFANPRRQHLPDLKGYARQIPLADVVAFDRCLDEKRYQPRLEADLTSGKQIGVTGTPTFVIGTYQPENGTLRGEIASGALPEADLRDYLERYLR